MMSRRGIYNRGKEGESVITTEREVTKKVYPLITMLGGFVSFMLSGALIGLISIKGNEGWILILGIPCGSLLMLQILRKLEKDNILAVIVRSEIGGFIGVLTGFIIGELMNRLISFLMPGYGDTLQMFSNILVLVFADAIFSIFIADLVYGRKAIFIFTITSGIASLPFGILLSIPVVIAGIEFDQNLVIILTSFGTTSGLSIGIYRLLVRKDRD